MDVSLLVLLFLAGEKAIGYAGGKVADAITKPLGGVGAKSPLVDGH